MIRAAVIAGLVTGCEDTPGPTGTARPGATSGTTPSRDPVVVAALRTAATQIQQVADRYPAVVRRHPALRAQLAPAVQHRTAHLARLKELGGTAAPATGQPKPVPATAPAAVAELVAREQALAVAHATAAVKLSGEPARVLAMIAAGETQLAVTMNRRPVSR